jgi:hypothetical protein
MAEHRQLQGEALMTDDARPSSTVRQLGGRSRNRVLVRIAPAALAVVAMVLGGTWPDEIARGLRRGFHVATLGNLLIAALLLAVVVAVARLRTRVPSAEKSSPAWRGATTLDRTELVGLITAACAAAGVLWYSLGRARVLPRTFADELLHEQVARGIAQSGNFSTHGYGLISGVIDALAFWLTSDGASAFHLIQLLNVIVMITAAVPAYLLARRVVSHRSALVVTVLTVLVPWMAYSDMVTTEAAFYPVFLVFILALVRSLERPSSSRQAVLAAALLLAFETRTQAAALVAAIVLAAVIYGFSRGRTRHLLRDFAPTWAAYSAVAIVLVIGAAAGVVNPFGAYQKLIDTGLGALHPHGLLLWTAANVTSISLGAGVLAALAFPLGVAQLLRRGSADREAAFASAAMASSLAMLATVVVLCESPYGTGTVGERNLFYVVPLLFIGAAAWVERGFPRPRRLTIAVLAVAIVLAVLMPPGSIAVVVDSRTFGLWTELNRSWFSDKWQMVAALTVGALLTARLRRGWPIALAALLTAIGVTAANDAPPTQPRSVAARYDWVDRTLPAGASATILYIGVPGALRCAIAPRAGQVANLLLYTEFFDLKVRDVFQAFGNNPARAVAAPAVTIGSSGIVREHGRPLRPQYAVLDAAVPIVGRRIAGLPSRGLIADASPDAALALWRVDGVLRLRRPQDVLTTAGLRRLGCVRS